MSIADKLTLLADTKESLRVKLNLGVDMPFSEYYKYVFTHPDAAALTLFADGKQGAWYDPSDRSTLFQDVEGIAPVTKDGDPVALMLDKSQGLATNSVEMVDADLGVAGNPYKIRGSSIKTEGRRYKVQTTEAVGQYGATVATVDGFLPLNVPVEIEIKVHALQIAEITKGHSLYVKNSLAENQGTSKTLIRIDKIGTYKARHIRTTDIDTLTIAMMGGVATVGDYIEFEVSIKEIKGNYATQSVSTARPIYKTDGILHWLEFDGVDDLLIVSDVIFDGRTFTTAWGLSEKTIQYGGFQFSGESGVYYQEYAGVSSIAITQQTNYQRVGWSGGVQENNVRPSTLNTPFVSYARNGDTFRRGNVPASIERDSGFMDFRLSPVGTLSIGNGYLDKVGRMSMYGFIWINSDINNESMESVKSLLSTKSGVTL